MKKVALFALLALGAPPPPPPTPVQPGELTLGTSVSMQFELTRQHLTPRDTRARPRVVPGKEMNS